MTKPQQLQAIIDGLKGGRKWCEIVEATDKEAVAIKQEFAKECICYGFSPDLVAALLKINKKDETSI